MILLLFKLISTALVDKNLVNNNLIIEVTTTTTVITTKIEEVSEPTYSTHIEESISDYNIKNFVDSDTLKDKQPCEKCYIIKFNSDKQDALDLLDEIGIQPKQKYDKNFSGVSFCTRDIDIVEKLRKLNIQIEEDYKFKIASTQPYISKHLFLMQNYTNYIFNSYFYNNIIFRVLQIDRIFKYLLGSYKYYYTGRNTKIYLLDTSVNVLAPNITNITGKKRSCNSHGDINIDLLINKTRGFARDANIDVLDGVACDGNIKLSKILTLLEKVKKENIPTLLLFGVTGPYSNILNDVVDYLSTKGIIIITPSGNNHDNACYYSPSSAKHVISIGSVDQHTKISKFSNYGSCVRLYSLGENIYESNFTRGTSHSAALITGAIAMYLEKYTNATNSDVWNFLERNSYWNDRYMVFKFPYLSLEYTNQDIAYNIIIMEVFFMFLFIFIIILLITFLIFYIINKRRQRRKRKENLIDTNLRMHRPT
ncbi:proprotein convertase subtilisin/kexin type 9 (PCSK9) [Vairimorpha necatrix]|uniref:Proprotein convertase subtilisin/kexin type 9 (PCSK9) n=1 Tax=Vairimorpha necatrix TaxID=6039 RepID=A0AAX4JFV9_9MICR